MDRDCVIQINAVAKKYNLYNNAKDRFKESVGFGHKKLHDEFYALNNISFDVQRGETVGIVGTNGSGKSTLLKIITGVLKATTGDVIVKGRVSALLELGAGFNQEYTGIENIYLNGRMMGYSRKEMEKRVPDIIEFAEIGDFIYQPVKTYSSGMFARLAFAVAINVEPDILIVDEALSVGDLFFQNKCFRKFEELKNKNITILFVSHDISSVRQMCSRVLWIEKGKQIIFDQSDKVCDMYMDMKRMDMNSLQTENVNRKAIYYSPNYKDKGVVFPKIVYKDSAIQSERVQIQSVFITNSDECIVNSIEVEKEYTFHVVLKTLEHLEELIVGIVVENNKGIPLYDINNYINDKKVIKGEKNQIIEVVFRYQLPRIMKGTYMVSAAVAKGTQERNIMLTWLHGVLELEVVHPGYNSSYIEIPAQIQQNIYAEENVNFE